MPDTPAARRPALLAGPKRPTRRFEWERALRASALRSVAKHVGLTIATYGDADGTSLHPGAALLQQATSTSEATVRRGLRDLVDAGYLVRVSGGKKAPGRARNEADEYCLTLPETGDHTDYQSEGLPVPQTGDCWSEGTATGSPSDHPPEHDQKRTSTAGQTADLADVPDAHRVAVAALVAHHRDDGLTSDQAARCVDDIARRNKPRNLAKYALALPLSNVLARASSAAAEQAPTRTTGPDCTVCGHDEAGCTRRAATNGHEFAPRPVPAEASAAASAGTLVAASRVGSPQQHESVRG